jgi:putative oxidoreductase
MNWSGEQKGEGFEYHLLALALLLVVMVRGSGAFSIDQILARNFGAERAEAQVST